MILNKNLLLQYGTYSMLQKRWSFSVYAKNWTSLAHPGE